MSFTTFKNEKTPFQAIKIRSSKSRRIAIFLNGLIHGFWTKMAFLTTSFYFSKIGHENVFCDILGKKNAFLGYKKKKFKKPKNCDFSKGVNPWFWYKNGHFSNFLFLAIQARKMSFTIFQKEKTPFQAIKTRSSKSRKIDIFPKGLTHGFGPKMAIFLISFLGNIGQERVFYDILKRKNALLRYKNKEFKKSKN